MSDSMQLVKDNERSMTYVPFGETAEITLTLAIVRAHIAVPTRNGAHPTDSDLVKFMMLCKARELNPWVGDAYLVGYDTQDGPKFSLITAIQALLKRAEANPNFDGLESGVVVMRDDAVIERPGNLVFPGENLYGGWARCYRKDRAHSFYDALPLATYNTNRSQWKKDPAGMIDKCAQASVLRMGFPTQLGSLYIEQERGMIERRDTEQVQPAGERVMTTGVSNGNSRVSESRLNTLDEPKDPDTSEPEPDSDNPADPLAGALSKLQTLTTIKAVDELTVSLLPNLSEEDGVELSIAADDRKKEIREARAGSNQQSELEMGA